MNGSGLFGVTTAPFSATTTELRDAPGMAATVETTRSAGATDAGDHTPASGPTAAAAAHSKAGASHRPARPLTRTAAEGRGPARTAGGDSPPWPGVSRATRTAR